MLVALRPNLDFDTYFDIIFRPLFFLKDIEVWILFDMTEDINIFMDNQLEDFFLYSRNTHPPKFRKYYG